MDTLVVIHTSNLDSWRRKLAGISDAARKRDWRLQIVDRIPSPGELRKLVAFWTPVGVILEFGANRFASVGGMPANDLKATPFVFIDLDPSSVVSAHSHKSRQPRFACVRHDPTVIAETAARELLSLAPAHFAFAGWFHPRCWCEDKRKAFSHILSLHGKGVSEFLPSAGDEKNAVNFQRRLRKWLVEIPKPCGLFAVNDVIAEAVLSAAAAEGIAVPKDLAVLGVDNDEALCERTHPTLTSILPDFENEGRTAVELVDRLRTGRTPSGQLFTVAPIRVVRRQSTRLSANENNEIESAVELIRREACGGLRARDVYRLFRCSRRLAEARFQKAVGRSVLREIHRVRLETAERLLADPSIPIKTVAHRSGWNSDIIFRRIYKSAFGKTPRDR